ncbi:MAG: hypothetical protein ABI566_00075 [Pseudolysinimonas sp.]
MVTAVLSLGVVALVAGPASAHHNTIWPEVTCATNGTYKVDWSVQNSESGKTEVITASNNTAIVPVGTSFGFSETKHFVQSVSTPQDITLSLTGFWDGDTSTNNDDVYNNTSFTLTKDKFPNGCIKVTPEATPTPSACVPNVPHKFTDPSYTLKPVTGVTYTVDNVVKAPGTYPATNGSTVHVVATVSDPKYQIVGTSTWDFAFVEPADDCVVKVVPVEPKINQQVCNAPGQHKLAQYFIPETTGVLYTVKINNVETPRTTGWYDVPEGVIDFQVIARADVDKGYKIDGDSKVYDLKVIPAGTCLYDVTPLIPTFTDAVCTGPGSVTPTTFTLSYVAHVVYVVKVNGGPATDYTIAQDTVVSVNQGDVVSIDAKVDDATKYQIAAAVVLPFTHTFGTPGDCKLIVTPVKPDPTHQYCDDSKDPRVVVDGTITIKPADNVEYYLDGTLTAPGTYVVAPGDHEVTIKFDETKFKLDPNSHTFPFKFTINPGQCLPTHPLLTPAAVSTQIGCFTAGSYTLSNNINDAKAVIWTVNGSQVAQGKYTVSTAGTVTITAAPNAPDYGFNPGVQTSWTVDFKKPAVCDVETLALTGQSPTGLLIAADLLVVAGLAMFAMRAVRRGRLQQV